MKPATTADAGRVVAWQNPHASAQPVILAYHKEDMLPKAAAEYSVPLFAVPPDLVKALEGFIASTDMIGRSRFHYAAEYDRFCKIRSDAIAALAAAKGAS